MGALANKKILITGSSRGVGKAIALKMAREGAEVIVHYHQNKEEGQAVAEEIIKGGGKAHLLQANLQVVKEAVGLGEEAWDIFGRVDCLINNAGVSYKKHFLDSTLEDVDYFININFKGTLFLTQTIAKKMVATNTAGSIYTVTSINGIQPGVGLSVYGASKGALETLMRGVALELAPHNIRVNTLAIGAIQTDMNASVWQDEEKLKIVNDNIPMGRLGQPDEIAAIVCGLVASDTYMTGASIVIDGGWMLKHGFNKTVPYNK